MTSPQDESHGTPITRHPDLVAMGQRYAGKLAGPQMVASEGLLMLAGAYAAISPWVVGFAGRAPGLAVNDVILGLIVAAMGLGLMGTPERSGGLSWTATPIGIWVLISTWIVPARGTITAGLVWSNVVVGAVMIILGLSVAGFVLTRKPPVTE